MNYIFEAINLMCSLLLLQTKHWKLKIEKERERKMWRNQKRIRTESVMTPKAIY